MKIKDIISSFICAVALCACSEIGDDERFITIDHVQPVRAVLIEEFTGQQCTNCPEGHAVIAALRKQHGTAVIPVSIHASRLSYTEDAMGGRIKALGIPEGETYYKGAGEPNLPAAVIDRRGKALEKEDWAAAVTEALKQPAKVQIDVMATYEEAKADIGVRLLSEDNIGGTLQVWLVENGIKAYQYDNGTRVWDYEHNHVLRSVVNGTSGTSIELKPNVYDEHKFSVDLLDKWTPANMAAVVFVFDRSGVLQAAEVPLIISESTVNQ